MTELRCLRPWLQLGLMLGAATYAAAAAADPQVDEQLARGRQAYERSQYGEAIALLRPLLYPQNVLSRQDDFVAAQKMLGISYIFEHDAAAAEQSFLAILVERPGERLDPWIDPPAAVELFETVKRRNAERLKRIEQRQRRELEQRQTRQPDAAPSPPAVVVERRELRRFWINFVPFGAGQFQNDQRTKGRVLLGAQAALGATSIACALALRFAYPDNRPMASELGRARALNATQVVTGGLFWATVAYGIVDALYFYQRESRDTSPPLSGRSRLGASIGPAAGGGSITLGGTF